MIAALVVASLPFVGLTETSSDAKSGLILDFGHWNVEWVESDFPEGTDGDAALDIVCGSKGYTVNRVNGAVISVNGSENELNISWGFYVMEGGEWKSSDPSQTDVSDYQIVAWARSTGPSALVPAADYTGYTYYSYANGGKDLSTGKDLRIVTLAPSVTETLVAVGALGYIVGTDLYSDYPKAVRDLKENGTIAVTGGYTDPNYEWIIKLNPDIVFCDGSVGQQVTMADKLRKSSVDCVVLDDAVDVASMYNNIWIAACSIGMQENATKVIGGLSGTIDDVSAVAGTSNKRVFVSLSADPSPWTAGSGTFMSDLIGSAGGINVFDTQPSSWFMVSKEQIYRMQPQVIIIIQSENEITSDREYLELLDGLDPMWKNTPAFKSGEVFVFSGDSGDIMSRPGPRLAQAAELIAKLLNPNAFTDQDPLDSVPKYFGDDYWGYLNYQRIDLWGGEGYE